MISGIAHICLRVADLERSVKFYTETLGMEKAFEFRKPDGTWFGQYIHVGGRNFIELFSAQLTAPAEGQSFAHFCLEVEDIEGTVRTLRERGAEVTDAKLGGDQAWQAWLSDPDGNRIELHAYTPEAYQMKWVK
ncbi:MAG: VOC family protein [Chloroflexi bacterium]|nr:VOC family protein [Chloroflexota bacterium]